MMDRRFAVMPLLALAGASLSGCVAVAIPALAGTAMVGSRIDTDSSKNTNAPTDEPAAAVAPTPIATPVASQAATVALSAAPAAVAATPAAPTPAPSPPVAAAAAPSVVPPTAPDSAGVTERVGFAQFVQYGRATAAAGSSGKAPVSAMLSDPIATDGKRRRCEAGEQPVALIDLDPAGGIFSPPANPSQQPGLALGLAVLREAGVEIAWLSDLSVNESGALRTALEQSGLDPRGEGIISLRRNGEDRKQLRKDNLAGITCIIAIAGDERPDFDERFKYLRNAEAGAELEPVIGDGWFLIELVFPVEGQQSK